MFGKLLSDQTRTFNFTRKKYQIFSVATSTGTSDNFLNTFLIVTESVNYVDPFWSASVNRRQIGTKLKLLLSFIKAQQIEKLWDKTPGKHQIVPLRRAFLVSTYQNRKTRVKSCLIKCFFASTNRRSSQRQKIDILRCVRGEKKVFSERRNKTWRWEMFALWKIIIVEFVLTKGDKNVKNVFGEIDSGGQLGNENDVKSLIYHGRRTPKKKKKFAKNSFASKKNEII